MSSEKRKNLDLARAMRDASQTAAPLELSAPSAEAPPVEPSAPTGRADQPQATPPPEAGKPSTLEPQKVEPDARTTEAPLLTVPSPPPPVATGDVADSSALTPRAAEPVRRTPENPGRPARRRPFTSLPESAEDWRDRYKVRVRPVTRRAPAVHRPQSVQVCQELADDFARLLDLLDPDTKPHQRRATSNSAILRLAIGELVARYRRRTPQDLLARFRSKAVRGRETTVRINYALEAEQWSKLQTWLLELNALPPLKPVIGLAHLAEVALEELIPRVIGSAGEMDLIDRLRTSRGEGD